MAKRRAPCDHEVKENAIGWIIHSKKEKTVKELQKHEEETAGQSPKEVERQRMDTRGALMNKL